MFLYIHVYHSSHVQNIKQECQKQEAVCQFCVLSSIRGVDKDKDEAHIHAHVKGIAVRCFQGWPSYFSLRSESKVSLFRKLRGRLFRFEDSK